MNNKHNIKLIALFNFLNNFRLYAFISILYFTQIAGSYTLGMSVYSIKMLSSAFFEIPTGVLSDFIGRKKTMVIGSVTAFIAIVLYAMSNSFALLAVGSIFQGFSRSLFSGNNDSLLHDSLKETNDHKDFSKWIGRVTALAQLAAGLAALFGGILANRSFEWLMWASAVPVFFTIIVSLFIKEPKTTHKNDGNIFKHLSEATNYFKTNQKLRLLSIIKAWYFSLDDAAYYLNSAFIVTLWPIWAIGVLNMSSKALGTLSFLFSGKIINKFGAKKIIYFRSFWDHLSRFSALIFPTVLSPILLSSNQFLWATGRIAEKSLLQKEFSDKQRSTMGSLISLIESIGFSIAALSVGCVADTYGPIWALLILQFGKLPLVFFVRKLYSKIGQ